MAEMIPAFSAEVTEVGEALEQIQETVGTSMRSQAAVLYDRENDWAIADAGTAKCRYALPRSSPEKLPCSERTGAECGCDRNGTFPSDYKVLAAPMAYMFKDGYEESFALMWKTAELWCFLTGQDWLMVLTDASFGGTPWAYGCGGTPQTETDAPL